MLYRTLKSFWVLSLPFFFYGLAFLLIGLAPLATEHDGTKWVQNVATACYAIASSSGSLFFALNFGDQGGAPVTSWVFRACVIQGTQVSLLHCSRDVFAVADFSAASLYCCSLVLGIHSYEALRDWYRDDQSCGNPAGCCHFCRGFHCRPFVDHRNYALYRIARVLSADSWSSAKLFHQRHEAKDCLVVLCDGGECRLSC